MIFEQDSDMELREIMQILSWNSKSQSLEYLAIHEVLILAFCSWLHPILISHVCESGIIFGKMQESVPLFRAVEGKQILEAFKNWHRLRLWPRTDH